MTSFNPNAPVPNAASQQPGTPQDAPHRPPDDMEEVYYQGSPLLRGALGKGFLWIFCGTIQSQLRWRPSCATGRRGPVVGIRRAGRGGTVLHLRPLDPKQEHTLPREQLPHRL